MSMATEPRTNKIGKVAAVFNTVSDGLEFVISRGEREGVKLKDFYGIRQYGDEGDIVAMIQVIEVMEKMAIARPVWATKRCPIVTIGLKSFLLEVSSV